MMVRDMGLRQLEGPIAERHFGVEGTAGACQLYEVDFTDENVRDARFAALLSREVVQATPPAGTVGSEQLDVRWHLSIQGRRPQPVPWHLAVRAARRIRPGVMWAAIAPPGGDVVELLNELHFWELQDNGIAAAFAVDPSALWTTA